MDRWGLLISLGRVEEPPVRESETFKLFNAIKTQLIQTDDSNVVVYTRESDEGRVYYYAKNPYASTIHEEKVLYAYLEQTNYQE